jgi:hypothetical protein
MLFAECLGFYDGGFASMFETYKSLCENGELVEAGGFKYLKWVVGEHLELWTPVKDGEAQFLFNSYYAGETRMTVALIEKTPRHKTTLSDGAFLCRGRGFAGRDYVGGLNPFIFDTMEYHLYDGLVLPRVATVQLTAFAFAVTGFEDDEAYDDEYPADANGYSWDYRHFIPELMWDKERGEGGELQSANAEVSGFVEDTAILTNPLTGIDFCWARLDTIGGEIDVVCPPERLGGFLVKGGIAVALVTEGRV